jgi:hypothetical protein
VHDNAQTGEVASTPNQPGRYRVMRVIRVDLK